MTLGGANSLRFSVIVASWKRPEWLQRCLLSVRQQDYPAFEVIVVADRDSISRLDTSGLKLVEVSEANLSKARNAGVRVAAGDVCAFIDDDAAAEPMWLFHLADALSRTSANAVVGYVRGRNGISFQSRVASVDAEAETHEEEAAEEIPFIPKLRPGRMLKLVGTNFAIMTERLQALGGFDPGMKYFLEDADLSLRLGLSGGVAAVSPLAQVHHGFAKSSRRTSGRTPIDLHDIGRSTAIFLRKHFSGDFDEIFARISRRERKRLVEHMVRGNCEPRDVIAVLQTLSAGWRFGMDTASPQPFSAWVETEFEGLQPKESGHDVLAAPLLRRRAGMIRAAEDLVHSGRRVSVFSFSLTLVRHYVRYSPKGVWIQSGGLFGRADRVNDRLRWCKFAQRVGQEIGRIANVRGLQENGPVKWWGGRV